MSAFGSNHLTGINGCIDVQSGDGATNFQSLTNFDSSTVVMAILAADNANCVLSAYTDATAKNPDGSASAHGLTIPAGTIQYGNYTAITVSSGTARCYIR